MDGYEICDYPLDCPVGYDLQCQGRMGRLPQPQDLYWVHIGIMDKKMGTTIVILAPD